MKDITQDLMKGLKPKLIGRTIVSIRYMNDQEMSAWGWHSKPLIILLNDNTIIVPQRDDEGNDGGAMALVKEESFTIVPTI